MSERPTTGVLAAIVAVCFVAAFAAAAVLKSQTASTAAVRFAGSEAMQAAPPALSWARAKARLLPPFAEGSE